MVILTLLPLWLLWLLLLLLLLFHLPLLDCYKARQEILSKEELPLASKKGEKGNVDVGKYEEEQKTGTKYIVSLDHCGKSSRPAFNLLAFILSGHPSTEELRTSKQLPAARLRI